MIIDWDFLARILHTSHLVKDRGPYDEFDMCLRSHLYQGSWVHHTDCHLIFRSAYLAHDIGEKFLILLNTFADEVIAGQG
jgi:hypothetical protein